MITKWLRHPGLDVVVEQPASAVPILVQSGWEPMEQADIDKHLAGLAAERKRKQETLAAGSKPAEPAPKPAKSELPKPSPAPKGDK